MNSIERISVVVPMRDEARNIEQLVDDIAAQDFRGQVELIVADGGSSDGGPELLVAAAARAGIELTLVDNPRRFVSPGLNECIRRASGDLVVRMDAHSGYPRDYLRLCARASEETGAENVGGVFVAEGRTPTEEAVAAALESPFGGVNWTRDRARGDRVEVDTVYCGAFRPHAFRLAGMFDESLVRNQDDELNVRLRKAGGRIVLDPAIRARYFPRPSLRGVFRQYYEYGFWKVPVMLKHRRVTSARSLAPGALVISLAALALAAPHSRIARALLAAEAMSYGAAALAFGLAAVARRSQLSLLPRVVLVFPAFHLAYGAGMVHGVLRAFVRR